MGSECRSLAGTTHAASSATERLSLSRIFPAGGHLPSFLPLLEEDPLESRMGGSSFSTGEGIERFSLSASPGIPAAFLREKERKERKKIERGTRRLFHKCIAAIGDIIREARRKVQSNIFVFRYFPFTFEREPLVERRVHGLDSPVPGSVNPDGGWEGRLVYRHPTISRRFGDSVSYSEQRSLHPPILASTR